METRAIDSIRQSSFLFLISTFFGVALLTNQLLISLASHPIIDQAEEAVHVSVTDQGFTPKVVTLTLGTDIVWTNYTNQSVTIVEGVIHRVYLPSIFKAVNTVNNLGENSAFKGSANNFDTFYSNWESGLIPPGESFTYTFPVEGNNPYFIKENLNHTGLAVIQPIVADPPDLQIIKSDDGNFTKPGEDITYNLIYSNTGGVLARGVIVTETLPVNTTHDATNSTNGWQQVGTTNFYTYFVGNLTAGAGGIVTFTITVDDPLPPEIDTITNTVSIADDGSFGFDPTPNNNTYNEYTTISTGPTEVCGTINEDTTWTRFASPYVVTCDLTIATDGSLTVEPGAVIKLENDRSIVINGTLLASGTALYPIYITSIQDDTIGGDTNHDGAASSPTPGDWRYIHVNGGVATFDHTVIRYGGGGVYADGSLRANGDNTNVSLISSTISDSADAGIGLVGNDISLTLSRATVDNNHLTGVLVGHYPNSCVDCSLNITNSTISNNGGRGIGDYNDIDDCSNCSLVISGNTFTGNSTSALFLTGGSTSPIVANNTFTNNGNVAAIRINGGAPDLAGNSGANNTQNVFNLSGSITQSTSFPYLPGLVYGFGDLSASAPVTVSAGTVFKGSDSSSDVIFGGGIVVQGEATSPVYFTSYKDDSVGGDSNGDGSATSPSPGDWGYIYVSGETAMFDYTTIRYGGGSSYGNGSLRIGDENVAVTLSNSTISDSADAGIGLVGNDISLTLSRATVDNNHLTGVLVGHYPNSCVDCSLNITNSTISNNGRRGIGDYNDIDDCSNCSLVISGNTFTGNSTSALFLTGGSTSPIVANNTFTNNGNVAAIRINGGAPDLAGNSGANNTQNVFNLSGSITQSTSFPYLPGLVYGFGDLSASAPVTVSAGTVFKGSDSSSDVIFGGGIVVQGEATSPVYFTSYKDDSVGGDSNGDGSATSPSPGDWGYIYVSGETAMFDYTTIRYGGGSSYGNGSLRIGDENVAVTLSNSTISDSADAGIGLVGNDISLTLSRATVDNNHLTGVLVGRYPNSCVDCSLNITNSTISNNGRRGIGDYNDIDDCSNCSLVISGNTFTGNSTSALFLTGGSTSPIVANNTFTNNGNVAAIRINGGAPDLAGNSGANNTQNVFNLSGSITQSTSFPYLPGLVYGFGDLSASAPVTVSAGTVFKGSDSSSDVIFGGGIVVQGEATSPVYFTSYKDDSVGGDSNGDGSATSPSPGDWGYIYVSGETAMFDYTTIRYGGGSSYGNGSLRIGDENVAVTLSNSTISDSADAGIGLVGNDISLTLSRATVDNNHLTGVLVGRYPNSCVDCSLNITNSTISNNGRRGIGDYNNSYKCRNCSLFVSNSLISNNLEGIHLTSILSGRIDHTSIFGNENFGIYALPKNVLEASYNYWGSNDGPSPYGTGDFINTVQEWNPVCQCNITHPAVLFSPWLDAGDNVIGPSPQEVGGLPSSPNSVWIADPVNAVFGNYVYQFTDLAFPTISEDFAFQRTYNSSRLDSGPLGIGWTHSYHITVTQTSTNTIVIQGEDGRKDLYTDAGDGNYLSPPGVYDTLVWDTNHFVLTRKDQVIYTFNPTGTLATLTDPNGNVTSFSYSNGKLITITEPTGRQVVFTYLGELLAQISDPLGRTVSFGYTSGLLTSITDVNNETTTYTYDRNDRLQSITDANNHTFIHNIYDSEGRVVEQRDALNNLTTFNYDTIAQQTTVTDPLGSISAYAYDTAYRVISETDAAGNTTFYAFDASSNRTQVTDKRGNVTNYTYDNWGNILTITDPLGYVSSFTYDDHNNLLSNVNPLGNTTTYTYDSSNNLIGRTDALGNITNWTYNGAGLILSMTDPLGNSTDFAYDTYGYQTVITDALEYTTVFNYDAVGRLLSETDAERRTITYTYDDANRLLSETNPHGSITSYTYDLVGNRTSITAPRGNVTTFVYDAKDRLVNIVDPLGNTTTHIYDAVNNQIALIDPLNNTTTYAYDALNRRTSITDPLGHITSYVYDANGNRINVTDANGNATIYTYDDRNQLLTATDALGGTVAYAYDGYGNRVETTNTNGHITSYAYDTLNQLVSVTDPLSYTVSYNYDAVGNQINKIKADGSVITYTHDSVYRLVATTYLSGTISYAYDGVGNRVAMTDTIGVTTYTYDDLNRLIEAIGPNGTLNYGYDANGNRISLIYPDGKTVVYTFDLADQLMAVTDWDGRVTLYTYNNAGQQTGILYPNNVQATFTYDNASRLLSLDHVHPTNGTIATFAYTLDTVGNRLTMQDIDGTTTYAYDALYRLIQVNYPDGETISYTYDSMGNRTSLTSNLSGVTTYLYDAGDRLLSAGTTTFAWDANGNMIGKGDTTYVFDDLDRLTQIVTGTTNAQFEYDGDGVRTGKTINGETSMYVQDVATPLPSVLAETSGGQSDYYVHGSDLLMSQDSTRSLSFYHSDGLGSTRALSNLTSQLTDVYTYDVFGALRLHSGGNDQPFTFTGEQDDIDLGLIFLRSRYYDPNAGRFITQDKWPSTSRNTQTHNRFVYVVNNPVRHTDPSGLTYQYSALNVSVFAGLGAQFTRIKYVNLDTGEEDVIWVGGGGIGAGGDISYEYGISNDKPPVPGTDIRINVLGGQAQYDNKSGDTSIGATVYGVKGSMSSDGNASLAGELSLATLLPFKPVVSGTYNTRYRPGQLGDWMYDRFLQPHYSAELQRLNDEYQLKTRRQQSWQEFLAQYRTIAIGQPPSQPK